MEQKPRFLLSGVDRACIERYRDFLPKRVFDAHMHVYCDGSIPAFSGTSVFSAPAAAPEDYLRDMRQLLPGVRSFGMNCIPMPDPALTQTDNGLRSRVNRFAAEAAAHTRACCASAYILPSDSVETIHHFTDQPQVRALKCYAYGAGRAEIEPLDVEDFLPESAWAAAKEKKIPIILHLMHPEGISDKSNLDYVEQMTARYPEVPLVLAHCARSFASWTLIRQLRSLPDRENIWFDLSAICESGPMLACLLKTNCKRVVWGSDYPICMHRGRAITLAGSQTWLDSDAFSSLPRTYIAVENLQALYEAALLMNLDQTQVDDIFYHNALRLSHFQDRL